MRFKSLPLSVKATPRNSTTGSKRSPERGGRRRRDWIATIPILLLVPALLLVDGQVGAGTMALRAPAQVAPGERIVVTGQNLPSNARVQIFWDGSPRNMPESETNRRGELRLRLTVPQGASLGSHTIAAVRLDRGRLQTAGTSAWRRMALATTRITVVATAAAAPSSGAGAAVAPPTSTPTASPSPTAVPTAVPATPAPTAVPTAVLAPAPATVAPAPATPAPATAPFTATAGVWITQAELQRLPMSGAAWNSVVSASQVGTDANVSDQDSRHDQGTLAAAIYAARTGQGRDRAVAALQSAIGTEQGGRWLAVGRNLTGYIIAADLLGIRSGPIYDWLASFRTMRLAHNNSGEPITFQPWSSGSNASAQEGAAYTALAVYLGDAAMLARSWDGFRRYAGDRNSPHQINSNSDAWQAVPADPVGIQNAGASKSGCSIDGAISNDMSRGGEDLCTPGHTQYPWVGLDGAVPAAVILSRAGYPAWDVSNQALRRAAVYLRGLSQSTGNAEWWDASQAPMIKHLLNRVYGLGYPVAYPVGPGRTVGFTDYTHP